MNDTEEYIKNLLMAYESEQPKEQKRAIDTEKLSAKMFLGKDSMGEMLAFQGFCDLWND